MRAEYLQILLRQLFKNDRSTHRDFVDLFFSCLHGPLRVEHPVGN